MTNDIVFHCSSTGGPSKMAARPVYILLTDILDIDFFSLSTLFKTRPLTVTMGDFLSRADFHCGPIVEWDFDH